MTRVLKVSIAIALAAITANTASFAQTGYHNGYQVQGFRSYTPGFSGRTNSSNFNGGFGGLSPAPQRMPAQSNYQSRPAAPNPASTMQNLEQTLNSIDTQAGWARTPVNAPQQMQPQQYTQPQQYAQPPQYSQPQQYAQPQRGRTQYSQKYSQQALQSLQQGSSARRGPMQGLFSGVSRQEMMRVFMEGGSPQMGGGGGYGSAPPPSNNSGNVSTAYNNYQTAENESRKALNEANKARYDKDKWNRKNAATAAEYAANNANYAAQRAEGAASGGDQKAQSYANLARQAANRARQNANQARYNADTMP